MGDAVTVPFRPATDPPTIATGGFRHEIAGLRGVAVTAVILFHAGLVGASGGYVGVDVFFVISGFLMTRLLLAEFDGRGRIGVAAFYTRRVRRLVPSALLVTATTLLAARLLLPPLVLPELSRTAVAATLFVLNVRLIQTRTDYLADHAASPLQHYWTLGVEEQFYLVWPVAILLLAFTLRRSPHRRAVMITAIGTLAAISFLADLPGSRKSAPWAFFSLPARGWEFAVGAVVALAPAVWHRGSSSLRRGVRGAGLVGIAVAIFGFGPGTTFPGPATLLPVLATAAVVLSGGSEAAGFVLGRRPLQWLGSVSYPLYLWHWPLLILPPAVSGQPLGLAARAAAVLAAVGLAAATHALVERPAMVRLRSIPTQIVLGVGAGATAVVVALALAVGVLPRLSTTTAVPPLTEAAMSSGVPAGSIVPSNVAPALVSVGADLPRTYADGCHGTSAATTPRTCIYGDPQGRRSVALVGDSHAAQWFPALEAWAVRNHWRLVALTKSSCPAVDIATRNGLLGGPYVQCRRWRAEVTARLAVEHPTVIVAAHYTESYRGLVDRPPDFDTAWPAALRTAVAQWAPTSRVVVLGDTPTWSGPPAVCLSGHLHDPERCGMPSELSPDQQRSSAAEQRAVSGAGGAYRPTRLWLCATTCPALLGNTIGYRDETHLTATLSRLLAGRVGDILARVAGP